MDRRDIGSWLTSPGHAHEQLSTPQDYRGQRLGLPATGPGSVASIGRRVVALLIDWFSSLLIGSFLVGYGSENFGLVTLAIFAGQVSVFTALTGSSFGQRLAQIGVIRVDGGRLGVVACVVRTLLICLVIPPLIWDSNSRGLHDKAAGSVCVNRV
ncbi:MAG: RDD family protein [Actinobacteria bacterium]|nr:RDD family protein [Actinomycetota bacterium]